MKNVSFFFLNVFFYFFFFYETIRYIHFMLHHPGNTPFLYLKKKYEEWFFDIVLNIIMMIHLGVYIYLIHLNGKMVYFGHGIDLFNNSDKQ